MGIDREGKEQIALFLFVSPSIAHSSESEERKGGLLEKEAKVEEMSRSAMLRKATVYLTIK